MDMESCIKARTILPLGVLHVSYIRTSPFQSNMSDIIVAVCILFRLRQGG
jgi:hypothetical protein